MDFFEVLEAVDRGAPESQEWAEEVGDEVLKPSNDRLPLVLGRDEMADLVASGDDLEKQAWQTLYATGMREAELLALTPDDLKEGHLVASGRLLCVDLDVLDQLRRLERASTEKLFPWSSDELRKRLRTAARAVGISERFEGCRRKILPSLFRHAYGAHRLENGMDLISLKRQLGHQSLWTTMKLVEIAIGRWRGGYRDFHPLLKKAPALRVQARATQQAESDEKPEELDFRTKGQPAPITQDEVQMLMEAATKDRDRLIVRTLYASALRVGELAELCFLDLVPSEGRIFVRSGKGDLDRYTLIDAGTARALEDWRGAEPLANSVFDLTERQLNRIVCDLAEKTGLQAKYEPFGQTVSPHAFRHAHATHCFEAGIDIFCLKKLLGHTYLTTTELYVNDNFEYRRRLSEQTRWPKK